MICPTCQAEGRTSDVVELYATSTLMNDKAFSDEVGGRHHHDPNVTTTRWECSNGHQGETRSRRACPNPNCSYGKSEP